MALEEALDTPEVEPSSLFYKSEDVEADLEETTQDETTEQPTEEVEASEVEELESEESQAQEEVVDNENRIVDIDGREVSVKQILDWEKNGLMQSDYTRKRQADIDESKAWKADKQAEIDAYIADKHENLIGSIATVEELIKEANDAIDWDELREFDTGEYLKQIELKDKRLEKVEAAKRAIVNVKPEASDEFIKEQRSIMVEKNPNWLKDGKETEAYTQDMKMLSDYMTKAGYTQEENLEIVNAKHWQTILDAARYQESLKKVEKVKDKVKKLPVTTKPKKTNEAAKKSVVDLFYN